MAHILSLPVQLSVDLRFAPATKPPQAEGRWIDLDELAAMTRRPSDLIRLLWGSRYETLRVFEDDLPLSGVQAGALGLVALARTRNYELQKQQSVRHMGRVAFLLRALAKFVMAMPRELSRSLLMRRHAKRVASTDFDLQRNASHPDSVAYLRAEPNLHWLGAYVGGAATHTTGVVNGLVANGLDVHVFAPTRPEGIEGAEFTSVPLKWPYHLVQWLSLTDYSEDIARTAAAHPVDFVYQRYAIGSYAGLELARRLGVPLVLEFNGSMIWVLENWGSGRVPFAGTLGAMEERNLRDASLIVVVSEVLKEQLIEHGIPAQHVLVNPNGVDIDRLAPLRDRIPAAWRKQTGQREAPTVGFIGTFGLWHGVKVLPAIINAVARRAADARWILIGDGPLYSEVREEIEARGLGDRVYFPGVVDHESALQLLAACDVCVSPHVPNPDGTRFFGSPTKIFEYMGLGKAIVASDLEQIGQVLDHGRTGLLCPPGDTQAMADSVVRLLSDDAMRGKLGQAALVEAERSYTWNAHTQRILDALTGKHDQAAQPTLSP